MFPIRWFIIPFTQFARHSPNFGGPLVGIGSSFLGGIYRFLDLRYAGATEMAHSALITTFLAGLAGGLVFKWKKGQLPGLWTTAIFSGSFEVFHMALTLAMGYADEIVITTVKNVGLPMIISHTVGATLFVSITRNIITTHKLEKEILRFDRLNMVGQMAASVAHEIRNPLTSVRGYLQRIQVKNNYYIDKECCDLMLEELDRTNLIISEYLLLAKEKVSHREIISLNTIIHALYPLLHTTATAANSYIQFSPGEIPKLYLDKNEIRQLLLNLTNNGLEAMPAGGTIVIRTFVKQNNAILSISDQGTGIPSHLMEKLGTPFFTTKSAGTGLGLPICYRIAFRHDASIEAETTPEGTTFQVIFPIPLN